MSARMLRDVDDLKAGQPVQVLSTHKREGLARVRPDEGPRLRRWPDLPPAPSRLVPIDSVGFGEGTGL